MTRIKFITKMKETPKMSFLNRLFNIMDISALFAIQDFSVLNEGKM